MESCGAIRTSRCHLTARAVDTGTGPGTAGPPMPTLREDRAVALTLRGVPLDPPGEGPTAGRSTRVPAWSCQARPRDAARPVIGGPPADHDHVVETSEPQMSAPLLTRTVRVGVRLTLLACAYALLLPLLPGNTVTAPTAFVAFVAAVALMAIVVRGLDWERLGEDGRGAAVLEAWMYGLVALITSSVGLAGTPDGQGHLFLYLVVFFAGFVLRRTALFRVTGAAVAGASWLAVGADLGLGPTLTRVIALGLAAYLARLGSQLLVDRALVAETARAEALVRAGRLATVASSARSLATLDPTRMVERFVRAAVSLGFQTGNVCRFDAAQATYEVLAPVGHRVRGYFEHRHPTDRGVVAMVLDRRGPVVVPDYSSHPLAVEEMRAENYRCVVAVPIWLQDRIDGCLIVGTREEADVPTETIEALELLAALAGRALENAERFEAEQERATELARIAQLKSDFVSNVSHELRTPLTVIEGIGQTLEDRGEAMDAELRAQLVGRLNANARSLHEILNRLLDFSRLEAGSIRIHVEDVHLCRLADAVAERMGPALADHELVVDVERPLPVRADAVLVERVLENLLANAAKHTPPGTRVQLLLRREGGRRARLELSDDGPGIPHAELGHLTERFFRGGDPHTRERKGLGLGLALVDELLSLHGSELEVASTPGRGSSFAFELPLSLDAPGLSGRYDLDRDPRLSAPRAGPAGSAPAAAPPPARP